MQSDKGAKLYEEQLSDLSDKYSQMAICTVSQQRNRSQTAENWRKIADGLRKKIFARRRKRYIKKHRKQTAFQGAAGGNLAQDCGWIAKKDFRKAPQKI